MYAQSVISEGQVVLTDQPYYTVAFSENRVRNTVPSCMVEINTIKGHMRLPVGMVEFYLRDSRLAVTIRDHDGNEVMTTVFPGEPEFPPLVVTESDTAEEVVCLP